MTRAETATHNAPIDEETRSFPGSPTGGDGDGESEALRHERFQIKAKLGEGGMGVVYSARDGRDGREVALKLMKATLTGTARRRFEREFRSLSALRHPHCVGVYDYGELAGGPFFTMELFLGQPITSLASRPLLERLEPLLHLSHALDYIHGHGIVHRDVKPSNVLVRPAGREREEGARHFETRLMDFGLAKYYGVKSSLSAEAGFVGTLAYCAPEQINLDELDHRADLYSMGLVAYEVLSGRYAFPEARLAGMRPLMQAQLNDKPKALGEVCPEVPSAIADAVMKYLRKQPRRRPDSAALLRAAIGEVLGIDAQSMISGVSVPLTRPTLSVTGFVCRASEQETLENVVRLCLRPMSTEGEVPAPLIVVSGEPGIGKSSVVQETERLARGHGCQVFEGRCFDGNLSPFQPFVEIVRQLIAELKLQERRESAAVDEDLTATHVAGLPSQSLVRLLGIVNEYRGELLRIAPELRKYLPGEAYQQQADYGREADYIYRALASFFLEIAAVQPVCLSFEDLQWADKSSLDLLRHLAAALDSARRSAVDPEGVPRLVIAASARTGYAALEGLLAQLRDQRHVIELLLAPLTASETRELIALRLGCPPEEVSDDLVGRVDALCGGNPFFIAETVRDWFEKQAIGRSEQGWVLSTAVGDTTDLPETVRDVMRLRVQGLPPKAQQVLNAAAVIGAVVDIDLLTEAVPDLSESDVLDAIDALIPRRVFRETGNAGRVEFVHDLLRELPYADLSASRRRSLHRRVGELLEQRRERGQGVSAAVLAEHFRSAEDATKAFRYTVEAAEAALEAYAFNNAIAQLHEAQKLLPESAGAATRFQLAAMMGRACGCSGRVDDAIAAYTQALAHADDPMARATAHYGIGENYHRRGEFTKAVSHLDRASREVGFPRPAGLPATLFHTWMTSLRVHCLPRGLSLTGRGPDRDRRRELAFSANYLCVQMIATQDLLRYVNASYRMAAFAKESGRPEQVAVAYSKFALNWGMFGLPGLGKICIRAALKAVESRPHDVTWARTMAHLGAAHYAAGRLNEGEGLLRQAVEILDKVSDTYAPFTHHFLRHIYSVRGDGPRELTEAEAEIRFGTERGDQESLAWGCYGKADVLARSGRCDEARALTERAIAILTERKSLTIAIAFEVLGFIQLQASDYPAAQAALETAWSLSFKTGFFASEFMAPLHGLLTESLLGPRWWESPGEGGPSRAVARRAGRESRLARSSGWLFPNYGPHALRVSGRAACALGKPAHAARFFERAIVSAETLGARYELARAYFDASRVMPERADEYRVRGQKLLDELGAVAPEAERIA